MTGSFEHHKHDVKDPASLSNNVVTSFSEDKNNKVWVGTYGGGFNRFDQNTGKFQHFRKQDKNPNSLNDNRVMSLTVDHEGILWIGTKTGGLNRFDQTTQGFTHFRNNPDNPSSLSSNRLSPPAKVPTHNTPSLSTVRDMTRLSLKLFGLLACFRKC